MIRVAVLYPSGENKRFDMDYYRDKHFPLVHDLMGPLGLQGTELDIAISGTKGAPAPYVAIGYLLFETEAAYNAASVAVGERIGADIKNYTDIEPILQISGSSQQALLNKLKFS